MGFFYDSFVISLCKCFMYTWKYIWKYINVFYLFSAECYTHPFVPRLLILLLKYSLSYLICLFLLEICWNCLLWWLCQFLLAIPLVWLGFIVSLIKVYDCHIFLVACSFFYCVASYISYLSHFLFPQIFIPYTSFLLSDICLIQFFFPLFLFTHFCAIMFSGCPLKECMAGFSKKYNLVWETGELSYCGGKPVLLKAFQLAYCLNLFCLFGRKFLSEKYKMPMSNSSKETETSLHSSLCQDAQSRQ